MRATLAALWLILAVGMSSSQAQSMRELLQTVREAALQSRIAQSEIDEAAARLEIARASRGVQVFAGAGWGRHREDPVHGPRVGYHAVSARVGLRMPLLGSAEKLQREEEEARLEAALAEFRFHGAAREAQRLLLHANATLLMAERRIALGEAFLRNESRARDFLHKRGAQHFLLRSDHLDFLSMFDLARRELEKDRYAEKAAREVLRRLSGSTLLGFVPAPVATKLDPALLPPEDEAMAGDPDVRKWQAVHAHRLRELERSRWTGMEAEVLVAQNLSAGFPRPSSESTTVGVTLNMPLDISEVRRASRALARERLHRARLEVQQAEEAFRARAKELWARHESAQADLVSSRRQLEAAYAAADIAWRRALDLEGDVLEKLLQARYALYQAALRMSRSEETAAGVAIDVAVLWGHPEAALRPPLPAIEEPATPTESRAPLAGARSAAGAVAPEKLLGGMRFALALQDPADVTRVDDRLLGFAARWHERTLASLGGPVSLSPVGASASPPVSLGWFVWDGERWLEQPNSLPVLPPDSKRVFLSFRAETLDAIAASGEGYRKLRRLITALHGRGLHAIWLVGDPYVIFPQGRARLLRWLPFMAAAGVDGLNLDAELSQLEAHLQPQWLGAVRDTVSALRKAERLPIALTLHWRDALRAETAEVLTAAGLSEIIVMIYSTHLPRVAELVREIAKSWPLVHVRVAQSIEPDLDRTESSAWLGRNASLERWRELARSLGAEPNVRGVDVQSWEAFIQARP